MASPRWPPYLRSSSLEPRPSISCSKPRCAPNRSHGVDPSSRPSKPPRTKKRIGNDKLRDEGKTDQVVGTAKQAVHKVADTAKKTVKKVTSMPQKKILRRAVREVCRGVTRALQPKDRECPDSFLLGRTEIG